MRGLRMTMCAVSSQITPLTAKRLSTNILTNVLPNAIHVSCMAHILNLVGEDLVKDAYFHDAEVFTNDFKKAFKRQPKRKSLLPSTSRYYRIRINCFTPRTMSNEIGHMV